MARPPRRQANSPLASTRALSVCLFISSKKYREREARQEGGGAPRAESVFGFRIAAEAEGGCKTTTTINKKEKGGKLKIKATNRCARSSLGRAPVPLGRRPGPPPCAQLARCARAAAARRDRGLLSGGKSGESPRPGPALPPAPPGAAASPGLAGEEGGKEGKKREGGKRLRGAARTGAPRARGGSRSRGRGRRTAMCYKFISIIHI